MMMIRILTIVSLALLTFASMGCGDDDAPDPGIVYDAAVSTDGQASSCNFLSCDGCCDGKQCVTTPSKTTCGLNGRACQSCEGADECFSGSCAPPTTNCDGCSGCW